MFSSERVNHTESVVSVFRFDSVMTQESRLRFLTQIVDIEHGEFQSTLLSSLTVCHGLLQVWKLTTQTWSGRMAKLIQSAVESV